MYQPPEGSQPHATSNLPPQPPTSVTLGNVLQPRAKKTTVLRTQTTTSTTSTSDSEFSPHSLTQQIIPSEDPQRVVEIDEDEDDGGGDGIGEEGDDEDDDDENDDEKDVADEDLPSSETPPPRIRRPLPHWLLGAFKAHVAECEKRDAQGRPPLYSIRKTFWFEQQSTTFLLDGGIVSPTSLYNPRFFLWDPKALYKDLPCPNCHQVLQRHATISRPRRCIDFSSEFYIIGYRYRCTNCLHPKTKKKTVTFRSWDRRILEVLPPTLAAEFPAYLSHRSGMSKALFSWMRMCFSSGMGAKRFADALVAEHLLRYDELQLQYLDYITCSITMNTWMGKKYPSFLPFHDTSPDGRHGFVPRSQWFRDMYDRFMEDHRHEFNQHTAMLSAEICAIDHSHKVCRYEAQLYSNIG